MIAAPRYAVLVVLALAQPLAAVQADAQTVPAHVAPTDAALKVSLDALLTASYPASGPGATMVVTRGGRTVYTGASGLADVESGKRLTPDSVIRIGSLTKQFTAAVVLQLIDEGKVSLDDPVSRYFPGYPAPGGGATVRQLLSHSSGIRSYTALPGWMNPANTARAFTVDQLVAEFRDTPALFRPGERWAYSNSNYILLGGIIEKVTGKPWFQVVDERIARPLKLKTLRYGNSPADAAWAKSYTRGVSGVRPAQAIEMSVPQAAGGLVGSAGDFVRWTQALHHGRVVKAASYRQMIAPTRLNDGTTNPYGFGLANMRVRGIDAIGHNGGIFGGTTAGIYLPSDDIAVAIFANSDEPATDPDTVMRRAAAIALGRPYAELPPAPADASGIDQMFGVYRVEGAAGGDRRFFSRNGKLFVRRNAQPETEVFASTDDRFGFRGGSLTWFRIVRGADGRYAMEIHQGGEDAVERAVRSGPIPPDPAAVALPRATLERYIGRYAMSFGEAVIAFGAGDTLTIQVAGQTSLPLTATSATLFVVPAVAAEVTLDGQQLTLRQGNGVHTGHRIP